MKTTGRGCRSHDPGPVSATSPDTYTTGSGGEAGDRAGGEPAVRSLPLADQIDVHDRRAAVAFLEFGVGEAHPPQVPAADRAEPGLIERLGQLGHQVHRIALLDNRRRRGVDPARIALARERPGPRGVDVPPGVHRLLDVEEAPVVAAGLLVDACEVLLERRRIFVVAGGSGDRRTDAVWTVAVRRHGVAADEIGRASCRER